MVLLQVYFLLLQASIHSVKSRFPNISSLRDYYVAKYEENSPNFKLAQVRMTPFGVEANDILVTGGWACWALLCTLRLRLVAMTEWDGMRRLLR